MEKGQGKGMDTLPIMNGFAHKEYIEREAAINACYDGFADCRDDCADNIRNIPAAGVVPVRHGRWISPHWKNSSHCMNCNQCGGETQHQVYHGVEKYYHYCPHCGARMDGDA